LNKKKLFFIVKKQYSGIIYQSMVLSLIKNTKGIKSLNL